MNRRASQDAETLSPNDDACDRLVANTFGHVANGVHEPALSRVCAYWTSVESDVGKKVPMRTRYAVRHVAVRCPSGTPAAAWSSTCRTHSDRGRAGLRRRVTHGLVEFDRQRHPQQR